jgi:hypothetical protein
MSFVSDAHAAVRALRPDIRAALLKPVYPSARGPVAVIEAHGGMIRVRFNFDELERWGARADNRPMDRQSEAAVVELRKRLHSQQESLLIESGDCLILDNWRMCHGRSEMQQASRRVLRRVWVA